MGLGTKIRNAIHKCKKEIVKPFTRSVRHKIDDQHKQALIDCYKAECEALTKLHEEVEKEHNKVQIENKKLEELIKDNNNHFLSEKSRLELYLKEKENAFEESFQQITKYYKLLRSAILACSKYDPIIELVFTKDIELKANYLNMFPLHYAAAYEEVSTIKFLAKYDDINRKNHEGSTALDIAGEHGKIKAEEILKQIKADTQNFWQAYVEDDSALMKVLLEKGACINATLPSGLNILQQAIIDKKSYEFIYKLLKLGAYCYISWHEMQQTLNQRANYCSLEDQKKSPINNSKKTKNPNEIETKIKKEEISSNDLKNIY